MSATRDRLPLGVRTLFAVSAAATRIGLLPTPAAAVAKPADERQRSKAPRLLCRPMPTGVLRTDEVMTSRGGPMRLRVFRPDDASAGPAVLYIHGGGFVMGGLDACEWLCAELAVRTACVVVAMEYRLAPDHPFPAALEDCADALLWLASGGLPGVDPDRIAVAGDSAGGNLTAALALLARDGGAPTFRHQTLVYPFLDSTLTAESWTTCAGGGLDIEVGRMMLGWYVGAEPWDDPLVSPVGCENLGGLPPALIITADCDVLRDDGFHYAERLTEAGVPVRHTNYVRMPHGFLSIPRLCAAAPQALAEISQEIRAALELAIRPLHTPPRAGRDVPAVSARTRTSAASAR